MLFQIWKWKEVVMVNNSTTLVFAWNKKCSMKSLDCQLLRQDLNGHPYKCRFPLFYDTCLIKKEKKTSTAASQYTLTSDSLHSCRMLNMN